MTEITSASSPQEGKEQIRSVPSFSASSEDLIDLSSPLDSTFGDLSTVSNTLTDMTKANPTFQRRAQAGPQTGQDLQLRGDYHHTLDDDFSESSDAEQRGAQQISETSQRLAGGGKAASQKGAKTKTKTKTKGKPSIEKKAQIMEETQRQNGSTSPAKLHSGARIGVQHLYAYLGEVIALVRYIFYIFGFTLQLILWPICQGCFSMLRNLIFIVLAISIVVIIMVGSSLALYHCVKSLFFGNFKLYWSSISNAFASVYLATVRFAHRSSQKNTTGLIAGSSSIVPVDNFAVIDHQIDGALGNLTTFITALSATCSLPVTLSLLGQSVLQMRRQMFILPAPRGKELYDKVTQFYFDISTASDLISTFRHQSVNLGNTLQRLTDQLVRLLEKDDQMTALMRNRIMKSRSSKLHHFKSFWHEKLAPILGFDPPPDEEQVAMRHQALQYYHYVRNLHGKIGPLEQEAEKLIDLLRHRHEQLVDIAGTALQGIHEIKPQISSIQRTQSLETMPSGLWAGITDMLAASEKVRQKNERIDNRQHQLEDLEQSIAVLQRLDDFHKGAGHEIIYGSMIIGAVKNDLTTMMNDLEKNFSFDRQGPEPEIEHPGWWDAFDLENSSSEGINRPGLERQKRTFEDSFTQFRKSLYMMKSGNERLWEAFGKAIDKRRAETPNLHPFKSDPGEFKRQYDAHDHRRRQELLQSLGIVRSGDEGSGAERSLNTAQWSRNPTVTPPTGGAEKELWDKSMEEWRRIFG
jgi:hypothetical protein